MYNQISESEIHEHWDCVTWNFGALIQARAYAIGTEQYCCVQISSMASWQRSTMGV